MVPVRAPEAPASAPARAPAPPADPPAAAAKSVPKAGPSHASEPCGELVMTRARLVAIGRGENHPELKGVDALLAECPDKTPSPAACERARRVKIELVASGRGPAHPDVQAADAQAALCTK